MPLRGLADSQDGNTTDNGHKTYDANSPLHRIDSPSFNPSRSPVDGKGLPCGCKKGDQDSFIPDPLLVIPAWTGVQQIAIDLQMTSQQQELQGKLIRSFQTWTDFPLFQWHRWYDWNFHVEPANGYAYVRGAGNNVDPSALKGRTLFIQGRTMECEWDTGAFGNNFGQPFGPGSMFTSPESWAWPMTGQPVWLAGRWIYDCGHSDANDRMRSELHPCKAVASAFWEAAQFPADSQVVWPIPGTGSNALGVDTLFIPAVQFMFFASRLGGYLDFPNLKVPGLAGDNGNPRFIVDLPLIQIANVAHAIGPEHKFRQNTIVVKAPKLVAKFDFAPYQRARGTFGPTTPTPTVMAIDPGDGTAPRQAMIEIPLPDTGDAYGVLISIGWFDADNELAKRVVTCTVGLTGIAIKHPFFRGPTGRDIAEYRIGVNGRWFRLPVTNVPDTERLILHRRFVFHLSTLDSGGADAQIRINSHGTLFGEAGKILLQGQNDRTVKVPISRTEMKAVTWIDDIVLGNPDMVDNIGAGISRLFLQTLGHPFAIPNKPLGIVDQTFDARNISQQQSFTLQVPALDDDTKSAELFLGAGTDYDLEGFINVQPQQVP